MVAACGMLAFQSSAHASNFIDNMMCGDDLGYNTQYTDYNEKNDVMSASEDSERPARKYSIMELYKGQVVWTTYNGTRTPDTIGDSKKSKFNDMGKDQKQDNLKSASQNIHSGGQCVGNTIASAVANIVLWAASMITMVMQFAATKAVDPDFICQDAGNPDGVACIDLIGVIGGDGSAGSDGGIIGRLYSGMYSGLAAMVFAVVGIWLLYKCFIRHQMREGLLGLLWSFVAFLAFGVALGNPLLLAQGPMRTGTALGACVVSGINGESCMSSDDITSPEAGGQNTECYIDSDSQIKFSEMLALEAQSMSCDIWKAFILQPWSVGQFGTSYNNLYTGGGQTEDGKTNALFADGELSYWKNLTVGMLGTQSDGAMGKCSTQGYQYGNIALYQLDLMSSLHSCTNTGDDQLGHYTRKILGNDKVYADWFWVAHAMAQAKATAGKGNDDLSYMWTMWSGQDSMGRVGVAAMALVSSIAGSFIMIATALFAILYMITGTFLMAFAPLFMLIGIHPGQGRKIFLGWLEQVSSATMKYFASILWLVITMQLYSAVLGNSLNLGTTLIFVIVVSMAMWMYRKEFVDLIGRVDLGGQQFSNKMGEFMSKKLDRAASIGMGAAAGFAGGALAGSDEPGVSRLQAGMNMAGWNTMQQLKQGNGVVANAARAFDRTTDARRTKAKKTQESTRKKIEAARQEVGRNLNETHMQRDTDGKPIQGTGMSMQDALDAAAVTGEDSYQDAKDKVNNAADQRQAAADAAHAASIQFHKDAKDISDGARNRQTKFAKRMDELDALKASGRISDADYKAQVRKARARAASGDLTYKVSQQAKDDSKFINEHEKDWQAVEKKREEMGRKAAADRAVAKYGRTVAELRSDYDAYQGETAAIEQQRQLGLAGTVEMEKLRRIDAIEDANKLNERKLARGSQSIIFSGRDMEKMRMNDENIGAALDAMGAVKTYDDNRAWDGAAAETVRDSAIDEMNKIDKPAVYDVHKTRTERMANNANTRVHAAGEAVKAAASAGSFVDGVKDGASTYVENTSGHLDTPRRRRLKDAAGKTAEEVRQVMGEHGQRKAQLASDDADARATFGYGWVGDAAVGANHVLNGGKVAGQTARAAWRGHKVSKADKNGRLDDFDANNRIDDDDWGNL